MLRRHAIRQWLTVFLLCFAVAPVHAQEQIEPGFSVVSAESKLIDDVVRLNVLFDLRFSDKLVEALQSGVALTLLIEIEINKERSYLWSSGVASLEQRYQISYHPLTKNYVLRNLNSELEFQLPSLESLLAVITMLNDFPLLDAALLEEGATYFGEIRISVDRDSFPVPLRLMSYVTDDWHLSSEWFAWPLLP